MSYLNVRAPELIAACKRTQNGCATKRNSAKPQRSRSGCCTALPWTSPRKLTGSTPTLKRDCALVLRVPKHHRPRCARVLVPPSCSTMTADLLQESHVTGRVMAMVTSKYRKQGQCLNQQLHNLHDISIFSFTLTKS